MRLLFIRHGDPDYSIDGLTEKGKKEAILLSKQIDKMDTGEIYVSPMGRARQTASYSLEVLHKEEVILPWLHEFRAVTDPNLSENIVSAYKNELRMEDGKYKKIRVWDILPSYWTNIPEYYHPELWRETEIARCGDMVEEYDRVTGCLDELLKEHGYIHEGRHFRVEKSSNDTLTFFCHGAITSVFLSHLLGCSPFILLQHLSAAPSGVTEVVTEEREEGIADFRILRFADISHLNIAGEKPSFAGRFCESFYNEDERH